MRFSWLRRKAKPSSALPAEVLATLEGTAVYVRSPADDGAPRVIVQPAGMKGWMHGEEADSKALRNAFPELTDAQLRRACRYLASIVKNHIRQASGGTKRRRNWIHEFLEDAP